MLQFLFQIPFLIVQLIQAQVSLTRLNGFLNAEEIDKKAIGHNTKDETNVLESDNASFTWDISQHIPTISNINLNIKKSSTVAVVGQVFFFLMIVSVYNVRPNTQSKPSFTMIRLDLENLLYFHLGLGT